MSNNTTNSTTPASTSPSTTGSSSTTTDTTSTDSSAVLTTIVTTLISTISSNSNDKLDYCRQNYSNATCRLAEFIQVLAYLLLAVSLVPQIIHLFNHRSKYISGISYMWIIIRVLGLTATMFAHQFEWSSVFELIALISTIVMFTQIFIFGDNLHRQLKLVLLGTSLGVWLVGGGIVLLTRKYTNFLMITGYLLLSVHMLPQILLNLLLRTAKAQSKFSILFLAMSDTLLFASFYNLRENYVYLVTSYYAFSFFLFMYLQSLVYVDSHIPIISRSSHTVVSPGVEIFTGLDPNGTQTVSGQDPQMFSIDDLEQGDGTDVVYQPVTSNKSSQPLSEQTPMKRFVWYATLSSIVGIEIVLTVMIVTRAWTPWIIFLPLSVLVIIGSFSLIRTRLSDLQVEYLKSIL